MSNDAKQCAEETLPFDVGANYEGFARHKAFTKGFLGLNFTCLLMSRHVVFGGVRLNRNLNNKL
jgi:hypothetical protein